MKSSEANVGQIVILQTGGVTDALSATHIDYPEMFLRLLAQVGMPAHQFGVIDVRREPLPNAVSADGYLITGSAHSVYEDLPWIPALAGFVEQALVAGRPVVGICFGHQLLAQFFGGRVGLSPGGWRVGRHRNTLLSKPLWLINATDTAVASYSVLVSHQDQVLELPAQAQPLATHPRCEFAAFTIERADGGRALAIQGHPEFEADYLRDLLLERRERLGETVFAEGMDGLNEPNDSLIVAGWIKAFFEAAAPSAARG